MKGLFDQLNTTEVLPEHDFEGIAPTTTKAMITDHEDNCDCADCEWISNGEHNPIFGNADCYGDCSWPKHCK